MAGSQILAEQAQIVRTMRQQAPESSGSPIEHKIVFFVSKVRQDRAQTSHFLSGP